MVRSAWRRVLLSIGALLLATGGARAADTPSVAAILKADLPGQRADVTDALSSALSKAGYTVEALDAAALCDPARLTTGKYELLALPNAAQLPLASYGAIDGYLKTGGDILAFNAPMWRQSLALVTRDKREVWEDYATYREDYARKGVGRLADHVLFNFGQDSIKEWKRATNKEEPAAAYSTIAEGPVPGQRAFHAVIPDLSGWESLGPAGVENAFPAGHTLTVFCAKGAPETTELAIEWTEKDGSRWFAVIPLYTEWRLYVLEPKDFKFWESVPVRAKDVFHPENAARVSFGLAYSHTHTRGPRQEFWIGPLGTAKTSDEFHAMAQPPAAPTLDSLSPRYKLFDSHDVASLNLRSDQSIVSGLSETLPVPTLVRSAHPRPRGAGFDKGIYWRWLPIVEATTRDGEWRGDPVSLLAHASGPFKGGLWASFGVDDLDWYKTKPCLELVAQLARRMRQGAFILEGGSNYYTYFDGQDMTLGVRARNFGRHDTVSAMARVRVLDSESKAEVYTKAWPMTLAPGEEKSVSVAWSPVKWPASGYVVTTELEVDGSVVDRTSHEVHVWRPKKDKHFVTVKNGEFVLDGAPWRVHGVNYMPSSGVGAEDGEYFEYWIGARPYDPEVIERDLRHVKALGLNAVSIFIHYPSLESQNLLDILRRLDALGMKANVALRPGSPMKFPWKTVRDLIERYRLAENDTVFAYDLDWEPVWGAPADRVAYDEERTDWIMNRYGSIEQAEKDWGFTAARTSAGKAASPDGAQMTVDGEWRRMVAAYRRFLDTLLYQRYSTARRMVRSIDPNHLVSFRMADAGNPTCNSAGYMPYDFPYLGAAVDFLAPEAYGRLGDWEHVKPALFEYEYARWAAPDKPVIWAEAGVSAWAVRLMESPVSLLEDQGEQYRQFYRMLMQSGSNGIFFWWYPGGFRVGENSDYGIINPDGSDRPSSVVIRENAAKFLNKPPTPPVNEAILFDRDAYAPGLPSVYDSVGGAFWTALAEGKTPGLRTAGTGTTSADCPLVAVGNVPCNGHNPPKYLDASVDLVEVQEKGVWRAVDRRLPLDAHGRETITTRITLTNLGEASWVSPLTNPGSGAVYLVVEGRETNRIAIPHAVGHGETIVLENVPLSFRAKAGAKNSAVSISLHADGRTGFGPRLDLPVAP